jgi:hypothetical protein
MPSTLASASGHVPANPMSESPRRNRIAPAIDFPSLARDKAHSAYVAQGYAPRTGSNTFRSAAQYRLKRKSRGAPT